MGSIIHMETGEVRRVAGQFSQAASQLEQDCSSLLNQVHAIDWQGPARDQLVSQAESTLRSLMAAAQSALDLSQRMSREVEEWESVDGRGARAFQSFLNLGLIPIVGSEMGMVFADLWWKNVTYKEYQAWWNELSREDKLDYLNKHSQEIADKYGFPPMKIVAEDLPDTNGNDARGLNRGNELVIDVDNLDKDGPWRSVEIIAHESRHEYQEKIVQDYQQNGTVPDGMSENQIKQWADNNSNYQKAEDDFEQYWYQDIEEDARDFGNDYMHEVLDSQDWE